MFLSISSSPRFQGPILSYEEVSIDHTSNFRQELEEGETAMPSIVCAEALTDQQNLGLKFSTDGHDSVPDLLGLHAAKAVMMAALELYFFAECVSQNFSRSKKGPRENQSCFSSSAEEAKQLGAYLLNEASEQYGEKISGHI